MTALIITGLAAWITWETFLMVLPLRVPAWLQPVCVAALVYGLTYVQHRILVVLAVTAVVALLHTLAAADTPEPITLRRTGRRTARVPPASVGRRVPDLPGR